jgi:hypothetical protein
VYTQVDLQKIQYGFLTVSETYFRLMQSCLALKAQNSQTIEYIRHGFLRRLGTLQRCIQNIYSIYSPDRSDVPSRNECVDLAINLQSFIFNVFGSIDNLAWIWAIEKQLTIDLGGSLRPLDVSFQKKPLRSSLPWEFRQYLEELTTWFAYLENFRHALAHRIPLYIPPYAVPPADFEKHDELERYKGGAMERRDFDEYQRLDAEQMKLATFIPVMRHSYSEGSRAVGFHSQVLADWNTVAEIADKFLAQLPTISEPASI